jgi:hypothetical protein
VIAATDAAPSEDQQSLFITNLQEHPPHSRALPIASPSFDASMTSLP